MVLRKLISCIPQKVLVISHDIFFFPFLFVVPGMEPKVTYMKSKCSITELQNGQNLFFPFNYFSQQCYCFMPMPPCILFSLPALVISSLLSESKGLISLTIVHSLALFLYMEHMQSIGMTPFSSIQVIAKPRMLPFYYS